MASTFHFEILTPEKVFYRGVVSSLVTPGFDGYFGVLANHTSLIARSNGGKLKIRETSGEERFFQLGAGIVEVLRNRVVFLTKQARQTADEQSKTSPVEIKP